VILSVVHHRQNPSDSTSSVPHPDTVSIASAGQAKNCPLVTWLEVVVAKSPLAGANE
jgi:hypothetical protein